MHQRCSNPNHHRYALYGARGITVCERWRSFETFLADMGERPDRATIDRVDPDGNYEPSNCRWASSFEQAWTKRSNRLEPHERAQIAWLAESGYKQREIADFFGISAPYVSNIACGRAR
jgi:hypothetical protein